jgi:beta-barrel assembly-enhancing protease
MKYICASAMILLLIAVVSCSQKSLDSMVAGGKEFGTNVGSGTTKWGTEVGQNAAEHGAKVAQHVVNLASLSNESREDDLGQSVGVVVTNTYPVLKNDALQKYVTEVGLAVASTCPRPDIVYTYGILDTDEVNAFSGPNGYIFITKGAIKQMQDEAELAGVLGHEMSHVFLHHGLNQARSAEFNSTVSETVKSLPEAQQFSAGADMMVDAVTKVGYTQPQEFEADNSAVKIVADAGYDPRSYLNFLQRIAPLEAGTGAGRAMSTHPGGAERVKKVADQVKGMPAGGATLADRFKQNVIFQ